jgi:rhamnose utilization protein RhaD (predicted bifunctional aldolase and dehydrogenase)
MTWGPTTAPAKPTDHSTAKVHFMTENPIQALLELSHELGKEERHLAILGEGNTSTRLDDLSFAVKASGSSLSNLDESGVARCRLADVLGLFDREDASDDDVEAALLMARLHETDRKPSTEALFHAYLLTLPGVQFVGHSHPIKVNSLLCSPLAQNFAEKRMFPDEIVCCGAISALVPYVNPGVPLAQAIREQVECYRDRYGRVPRLILLQNHGIIALGHTPQAVLATTLMAEKAATIHISAASIGGPSFLSAEQVTYIAGWTAEHYRQKVLRM